MISAYLTTVAVVLPCCEPVFELPPFRTEAGNCRLLTVSSVALSRELPEAHCAFRDRLAEALEFTTDAPIHYGLLSTQLESRQRCADSVDIQGGVACAQPSTLLSSEPFHRHELVHAVLLAQGLVGTSALQEGAAEVFSDRLGNSSLGSLSLTQLTNREAFYADRAHTYSGAASFVAFLIDRHGEAAFGELLARTNMRTDLGTLNAHTMDVMGESIMELHAAWQVAPPLPRERVDPRLYECGEPLLGTDGRLTLVRGVSDSILMAGAARTFVVEREGELHVHAEVPAPNVRVVSCDRAPDVMDVRNRGRMLDERAPIRPGRYAIWLTGLVLEGDQSEIDAVLRVTVE